MHWPRTDRSAPGFAGIRLPVRLHAAGTRFALNQGLRHFSAAAHSRTVRRRTDPSLEEVSIMHACPLPTALPTDSILRRHFEQLASVAGLPQPPQDSVLLRHYRQLLDARLEQASATERPIARTATPEATATLQAKASPQVKASPPPQPAAAPEAPPVMRTQPTRAARDLASIPDRNPPAAAPTSWFSRLLARVFGK